MSDFGILIPERKTVRVSDELRVVEEESKVEFSVFDLTYPIFE